MDDRIISKAFDWKHDLAEGNLDTAKNHIAFFQAEIPESERLAVLAGAVNSARLYPGYTQFLSDANRLIGEFIDELVEIRHGRAFSNVS